MVQNPKCSPLENNINVTPGPPLPGAPGFSLDLNIPLPDLALDGIPEDILSLLRKLRFKLPGLGVIQSIVDSLTETVTKILSDILSWLNMFLGVYMFIMAIIELIMCIIQVLCAIPNVWAMIKAVKRLLRKCLPLFITIVFPWFALLNLLLALLALILALIEYIILMIIRLINQIIKNLKNLYTALSKGNTSAAMSVINKIASLLCLFEQIFLFLEIIFAVFEMITSMWSKTIKGCSRRGGESEYVCTDFLDEPVKKVSEISDIWETKVGSDLGRLLYCNKVYGSYSYLPGSSQEIRKELVYLFDDTLAANLNFHNIIYSNDASFFPFDRNITPGLDISKKPYTVDLELMFNPSDGYGSRNIQVNGVTVTNVTTEILKDVELVGPSSVLLKYTDNNGALVLSGGQSVDGYGYNGKTIEQLLRGSDNENPDIGESLGMTYNNITYKLVTNYDALAEYKLITINCIPSVGAIISNLDTVFERPFSAKIPDFVVLPDIGGALDALQGAFADYRRSIDADTTEKFGNDLIDIMNTLKEQTEAAYCQALNALIDPYNTNIALQPSLQFTSQNITVEVVPSDTSGRTFSDMIGSYPPPESCLSNIADKFKIEATFGKASAFTYSEGKFVSTISSVDSGDGEVKVYFDGNQVVKVIRPEDLNADDIIDDSGIPYSFIGINVGSGDIRRDEVDAANS